MSFLVFELAGGEEDGKKVALRPGAVSHVVDDGQTSAIGMVAGYTIPVKGSGAEVLQRIVDWEQQQVEIAMRYAKGGQDEPAQVVQGDGGSGGGGPSGPN
jgi:hypothetical protein